MELRAIDQDFSICEVSDFSEVDLGQKFCFTGKTDEECSLVCLTDDVPSNTVRKEDGWKAFRIQGKLDFSQTGILSAITDVLARNEIGIFVISTFDTDYVLVKAWNYGRALEALKNSGYKIIW